MMPRRSATLLAALALAAAFTTGARRGREEAKLPPFDPAVALDRAILAARQAVEKDPGSGPARVELGNAYLARGHADLALEQYEEATRLEPEYSEAWNNQGIAESMQGRPGRAKASFRRAVQADERNAEAHFNLAMLLERDGSFSGAMKHFEAALSLRPELGEPLVNPRSRLSRLLPAAKVAIYRQTIGGTLPPLGPGGESALRAPTPAPTPEPPARSVPTGGAPEAAPAPTGAQTPIVLGPGSPGTGASGGSGSRPAGDSPRSGSGRGIRRGGPQPKPGGSDQ